MARAFVYVVDRDFGFAPNPFHGSCTLATCKPRIRSVARVGDWLVGLGGSRLKAAGRCVYAMKVTERITFEEYWSRKDFEDKRPLRNGSPRMMVGDNIYRREGESWIQADSHHSLEGGAPNPLNVIKDTSTNAVLVSRDFRYFGLAAPEVPTKLLTDLGYSNGRNHRTFEMARATPLIEFIKSFPRNVLLSDPFDFDVADSRYAGVASKIVKV